MDRSPPTRSWNFCRERVPHPVRQAGLDPVAPEQLALGPSQEVAALAVDQRDPPVQVEREQDDFGRVEIALRPVPLVAQRRLRLLALEDLVRALGRFARVEIAVLVDAADLSRQRHDQVFVVLGEGPCPRCRRGRSSRRRGPATRSARPGTPEPPDGAPGAAALAGSPPGLSPRSVRRSATTVPRIPETASPVLIQSAASAP